MANKAWFEAACEKIVDKARQRNGIGTLGEKTLHAVIKHYIEPDEAYHEIRVSSFVADIMKDRNIIEIQTRNFGKMRKKLNVFLKDNGVTIVYPVAAIKWLTWLDGATGEISNRRKSPRRGTKYDILPELYRIREYVSSPGIRFCILMLEVEECRNLNGWGKDKKRGSTRHDGVPLDIIEEVYIDSVSDFSLLVPDSLDTDFTVKDYHKATKMSLRNAGMSINVLYNIGIIERMGKNGNQYIYSIAK